MTRILDVDLIEEHFDLFVRALCHQAKWNIFEPDDLLVDDYPQHWRRSSKIYRKSKECLEIHKDGRHPFEGCCVPRDPFNIPGLRDLLRHPQRIQQEAEESKNQIEFAHTSSSSSTSSITFPTDVILAIMDFLPGRRDIELLLWAFPQ